MTLLQKEWSLILQFLFLTFFPAQITYGQTSGTTPKPNIIIFYADDLGYGDLGCYGAKGVRTPSIDALAENGIRFTDAHSSAATCTPSRYSLLTGNYAFRMQAEILNGDAGQLIPSGSVTLASKLKEVGYHTGVVGKWHLGLGRGDLNWNEPIFPGPREVGFDYSFLLPATGDRVPTVFVENQKVVGLQKGNSLLIQHTDDPTEANPFDNPTGINHPHLLKQQADTQHSGVIVNGMSRIGFMKGQKAAYWKDEEFYQVFTDKAVNYITENKQSPFFLYFSFHDIHVPRMPNERFKGKSSMGPRGDAIVQMDWMVGEVMAALKKNNLTENTLVIFTSDNGPVLNDGYQDQAVALLGAHTPGGIYRGGKYSIYEAGNRMPTIAYWPGKIIPGVNGALWSQVDLLASLSGIAGYKLTKAAQGDSQDMSQVLFGKDTIGRTYMLEEAMTMALRKGKWKYIAPTENDGGDLMQRKNIELGLSDEAQLYDLNADPTESRNLYGSHPQLLKELQAQLERIVPAGNEPQGK